MRQGFSYLALILDKSGSMDEFVEKRQAAISGFNDFLADQKAQPGEAVLKLVMFSDPAKFRMDRTKPLNEVQELNNESYFPDGMTAMNDAICLTIDAIGRELEQMGEADRPEHVIVGILTDGEENFSQKFSRKDVFDRITHQQEAYNWKFVFLSAGPDAFKDGASMGIPGAQTISFANSAGGVKSASHIYSSTYSSLRSGH